MEFTAKFNLDEKSVLIDEISTLITLDDKEVTDLSIIDRLFIKAQAAVESSKQYRDRMTKNI